MSQRSSLLATLIILRRAHLTVPGPLPASSILPHLLVQREYKSSRTRESFDHIRYLPALNT